MISNITQNPNTPNFGLKIKIREGATLYDMADSFILRNMSRFEIDNFTRKSETMLPDKTLVFASIPHRPAPFESYDFKVLTNNKETDVLKDYYPREIMAYIKKALNPQTVIHSKIFYNGEKSPETLARVAKFKETNARPQHRLNTSSN